MITQNTMYVLLFMKTLAAGERDFCGGGNGDGEAVAGLGVAGRPGAAYGAGMTGEGSAVGFIGGEGMM